MHADVPHAGANVAAIAIPPSSPRGGLEVSVSMARVIDEHVALPERPAIPAANRIAGAPPASSSLPSVRVHATASTMIIAKKPTPKKQAQPDGPAGTLRPVNVGYPIGLAAASCLPHPPPRPYRVGHPDLSCAVSEKPLDGFPAFRHMPFVIYSLIVNYRARGPTSHACRMHGHRLTNGLTRRRMTALPPGRENLYRR